MFRGDCWGLGDPWVVLGAIWSQECFQNRRTWFVGPPVAYLADPKIDKKSLKCIHVGIFFFKKVCPKTGPQARSLVIQVACNFGDPGTLFFELSPARELHFSKKGLIPNTCQKTSKSETKWKPEASNFESKGQQMCCFGKQNAVPKNTTQHNNCKSSDAEPSVWGGGGGPFNQSIQDIHRANMGLLTFHFVPRGTVADILY